jgi:hypothetical protein
MFEKLMSPFVLRRLVRSLESIAKDLHVMAQLQLGESDVVPVDSRESLDDEEMEITYATPEEIARREYEQRAQQTHRR